MSEFRRHLFPKNVEHNIPSSFTSRNSPGKSCRRSPSSTGSSRARLRTTPRFEDKVFSSTTCRTAAASTNEVSGGIVALISATTSATVVPSSNRKHLVTRRISESMHCSEVRPSRSLFSRGSWEKRELLRICVCRSPFSVFLLSFKNGKKL